MIATPQPVAVDSTTYGSIINGTIRRSQDTFQGINPATEELIPQIVYFSNHADVESAVEAAKMAFNSWSTGFTIEERRQRLLDFAECIESKIDQLSKILTTEHGMPVCILLKWVKHHHINLLTIWRCRYGLLGKTSKWL